MTSLGEDFPIQQARCRRLITQYQDLRGPGVNVEFAIAMIDDVLARADRAAISGDVIEMIRCYEEMKDCQ